MQDNFTTTTDQKQQTTTRRRFIGQTLAALALATANATQISAAPLSSTKATPEITKEQAMNVLGLELVYPEGVPEPYPDPERTAIIDRWIETVDETIIKLVSFWTFLHDARAMSPDATDGTQSFKLMTAAQDSMNDLCHAIECSTETLNPDKFLIALSNEPISFICIRDEILHHDIKDPDSLQLEIDYIRQDYPEYGAELQRLFDERFGGKAVQS